MNAIFVYFEEKKLIENGEKMIHDDQLGYQRSSNQYEEENIYCQGKVQVYIQLTCLGFSK